MEKTDIGRGESENTNEDANGASSSPPSAAKTSGEIQHAPVRLNREIETGLRIVSVETPRLSEFHLTVTPLPGEAVASTVRRLADSLSARNATVVRQMVFGSLSAARTTVGTLRQAFDEPELPCTWVDGAACAGGAIAGIQVHAVSGANVRTVGRGVQSWDDGAATHCVLNGLGPRQTYLAPQEQARETFEQLQAGLASAGMTMREVARTWLFLDGILGWYGELNRARNAFLEQCELRPGHLPASTGVGGRNPAGTALTAAAWAVRSFDESRKPFHTLPSPRQCPACAYGSAFSRAVEIHTNGVRQLLVSGTASISPDGRTAHVGDVRQQIELSMDVVGSILTSRGMDLSDVSRATAYFRSPTDAPAFAGWLAKHDLSAMPVVNAACDICRDDLLFEIELDAIKA